MPAIMIQGKSTAADEPVDWIDASNITKATAKIVVGDAPVEDTTPEPTPEPTPDPIPEPDEYDPEWVYEAETVKSFNQMLIELGWLSRDQHLLTMDEAVYQAIAEFQAYYNMTYADANHPKLTLVMNEDGSFTDAFGNFNPIDEETFMAIMTANIFYPY